MSTFANDTFTNPLTAPVGITPSDKITSDLVDDVVKLDGMCYTKRRQIVASHSRRDFVATNDGHPLRPALIPYSKTEGVVLCQFVWGLQPDILPGSDGKTVSAGTTLADRGGFEVTTVAKDIVVIPYIQRISIAGTYGQSTAFVGTATSTTLSHGAASETRLTGTVLLPVGTTAGERVLITLFAGGGSNAFDKYVQHWCIDESYSSNLK
jgi:hypothetical protein